MSEVKITTDQGLTDIVGDRHDAGVRRGGLVAKDMIAVPIGPETRRDEVVERADEGRADRYAKPLLSRGIASIDGE